MNDSPTLSASGGSLAAIWIKRVRRGPMDARPGAQLIAGQGLEDNANQGGKRQVTLLDADRWREVCAELDAEVDPELRRANLLLQGIDLENSRGKILRLGGCRLEICGETRPCRLMDESFPGLQAALDPGWRGGAYAVVLDGGELEVGMPATWEQ